MKGRAEERRNKRPKMPTEKCAAEKPDTLTCGGTVSIRLGEELHVT